MHDDLPDRLRVALAAKGPSYVPRTHHLEPSGQPRFCNRLLLESSPYLLQHAHNPVNWYPWGDEAFAEARRLDRPVFLSIGYSTCHWCHVMEGESFEDEEIAAFLNAHFIAIKVDREERPDVDAVYMAAVQALTGRGGWPMSVWLTPAREPFFGGTYFPPRDGVRGARRGFLSVLGELAATWQRDRPRVQRASESLTVAVRQSMDGGSSEPGSGDPGSRPNRGTVSSAAGSAAGSAANAAAITAVVGNVRHNFDPVHGGLRRAPKFPSNVPVRLLLRHHRRTGDTASLDMATLTLEKMAAGGLYDQLGGGFHRYSTDERWLVPHFEKMLYDNALLAVAYAEAFQVTGRPDFARVLRETLDYVLREMTSPEGAFYSATDADSEGEEGRFFVWDQAEIEAALGAEAPRFLRHYGVTPHGNFEGRNILHVPRPDEAEHAALAGARGTLYAIRAARPHPLRDDKILAAWNGLMVSAFALAGRALGERRYVAAAERAASFLLGHMKGADGRLRRSHPGPQEAQASTGPDAHTTPAPGFLEDQSFVVAGLLDLFEATGTARYLCEAVAIAEALERHFADGAGGWFMTAADSERLIAREKPSYDGAEPSGTAVALLNALRLAALTGDDRYRLVAERAFAFLAPALENRPLALTETLLAVDWAIDVHREIVVVVPRGNDPTVDPLARLLYRRFVPNKVSLVVQDAAGAAQLARDAPLLGALLADKRCTDDRSTAYVCERGRCALPTTDPDTFARQLDEANGY